MPEALQGKPIIITGASAGIGRATAIACARAGMPVLIAARREQRLQALVDDITAEGGRAVAIACDVNDPDQCDAMAQRCLDAFGSIHAILANAGYGFAAPIHETTDQALRDIFETNLFGTINTIRPALRHMIEQRAGHILITSSSIGLLPIAHHAHYCATKAAQHHIGRGMAAELRHLGIRVSTIHPVGTKTEFFDKAAEHSADATIPSAPSDDKPSDIAGANTPRFLMQSPETVAKAIERCLARPRAEVWPGGTWWVRLLMASALAIPPLTDAINRAGAKRQR
ncbi:MAG: SDR family NAD(P)-dependent oxidoreductase [Phycisphaerales bacterium]